MHSTMAAAGEVELEESANWEQQASNVSKLPQWLEPQTNKQKTPIKGRPEKGKNDFDGVPMAEAEVVSDGAFWPGKENGDQSKRFTKKVGVHGRVCVCGDARAHKHPYPPTHPHTQNLIIGIFALVMAIIAGVISGVVMGASSPSKPPVVLSVASAIVAQNIDPVCLYI